MPRLSLYRPNKTNDYKFLDRTIKEMFTVGGTDLYIHKYIGTADSGPSKDLSQPQYDKMDPTNIQDLLFLENRDRKFDKDIYQIRGHYNVQNLDFDLSQFGLFLNNDIIFITIHYNTMIELIGRKLMVGDVLELPHLTDYHPLNETIPVGLRRYYQITDGNFASEGFTQTWYPHLWRIKCEPLVDSQEFSNILSAPLQKDNYLGDWNKTATYVPGYTVTYGDKTYTVKDGVTEVPANIPCTDTNYWTLTEADSLRDILGRYNKNIEINDAMIAEAARIVPKTGYDRSQLYLVPTNNKEPDAPVNLASTANAPVPTRATVQLYYSPGYSTPVTVLNIGAQARQRIQAITPDELDALTAFMKISLETAKLAPQKIDTGAGQVDGTMVLAVTSVTGPYGTADNTYSSADQYPALYFQTSGLISPGDTSIPVTQVVDPDVPDMWYENPGLLVDTLVTSLGSVFTAFLPDTHVIDVDLVNNLLILDKPVTASVPGEAFIKIASNFTGEPVQQNVMDYRADADPRFTYVKYVSPQSFGYQDGYMIGDGTAPNGLPTGAGSTFPINPSIGDYFLRTDYLPNLLYRYDGSLWVRIGKNVRADGAVTNNSETQLGSFINNNNVTTLTDGTTIPEQQSLTDALRLAID
jgi:hypothetical protein